MRDWDVPGYTTVRVLGSGGFGEVVLARHDASDRLVAIKYLHQDRLTEDPVFAELFRAEARVLASLDDPHVVRLYEYVESPAGAAIVMELIDGVSAREILAHQGKTTAEAALVVLQGSLLGLAAAHAAGVVHRDYKPENVLVDGVGASKLTDFGIAARSGDRPIPAGTLAYAPPEQFTGSPATPAADVYAATATFYECLTGHPPFTGDTAEALLYQHMSVPVPLDPVPGALRPLVTAGMAKDPADRPADAAAFVTELRAAAWPAYGQDWEDRGRSHLAEAALLLAALWPSSPPAVQGRAVQQVHLSQGPASKPQDPAHAGHPEHLEHVEHVEHVEHEEHLAHLRHLRREDGGDSGKQSTGRHMLRRVRTHPVASAVIAGAAAVVVAVVAVVAVAAASSHRSAVPPPAGLPSPGGTATVAGTGTAGAGATSAASAPASFPLTWPTDMTLACIQQYGQGTHAEFVTASPLSYSGACTNGSANLGPINLTEFCPQIAEQDHYVSPNGPNGWWAGNPERYDANISDRPWTDWRCYNNSHVP